MGVINGIRAFLPILISQGEGHIVNTASIAGLNPGSGPAYAASKHAVVALSEELFNTTKMWGFPWESVCCAQDGSALPSWTPIETGRRVWVRARLGRQRPTC